MNYKRPVGNIIYKILGFWRLHEPSCPAPTLVTADKDAHRSPNISYMWPLSLSVKSQPHKWHIWFFPTHKPTLKKPKEPFFLPTHGRTDRQLFQQYLS